MWLMPLQEKGPPTVLPIHHEEQLMHELWRQCLGLRAQVKALTVYQVALRNVAQPACCHWGNLLTCDLTSSPCDSGALLS